LSSTTDPVVARRLSSPFAAEGERGQIIVLFAGALFTICLIAAIVFDVGQSLLDRRAEQNAADAASLAGARYVVGASYTFHNGCAASPGMSMQVVQVACDIAAANGYTDGVGGKTVRVDYPPIAPSAFAGLPNHVQVTIGDRRGSFFAGLIGVGQLRTGSAAVATNDSDIPLPYSLLALDPTSCGVNKINGAPGTAVTTDGTVHIDSNCPSSALLLSGNGVLTAPECDVVGDIQTSGGATNNCTSAPSGVLVFGDPLKNLPPPAEPALPAAVQPLDAGPIPNGCPGSGTPATDAAPSSCDFSTGPTKGHQYRIFPGTYPGGLSVGNATVLMSPGIYWIGGGGVSVKTVGGGGPAAGDGVLVSKAIGDDTFTATASGGVLIYNTADPVASTCVGGVGAGCYGAITLNGGAGATLSLRPIQSGQYQGMVIFVDRALGAGGIDDVVLNGAGSILNISGTIYAPTSMVKLNGSDTDSISAQLICFDFQVNGSGAAFTINYRPDDLFHLKGVGLVE
jgi:putative Flp pilus-assembly TadE/G-like protein